MKTEEMKATEILAIESIKDGHYLVQMERAGDTIFANFKISDGNPRPHQARQRRQCL